MLQASNDIQPLTNDDFRVYVNSLVMMAFVTANQGFPYATTGDENWNSSIEVVAGEERRRKNQSEGCREMI